MSEFAGLHGKSFKNIANFKSFDLFVSMYFYGYQSH